jgi:hypothetical protein
MKRLLWIFLTALLLSNTVTAQEEADSKDYSLFDRENSFPVFDLSANLGSISYINPFGGYVGYGVNLSADINAEKFKLQFDGNLGNVFDQNSELYLETRTRMHMLFINIDDFTYRRIGDIQHTRVLAGFGSTHQWNDKVELGFSLGGAWWSDTHISEDAYGLQSTMSLALRFGHIENNLLVSVYQNFNVYGENFTVDGDVVCAPDFTCDLRIDGASSFEDAVVFRNAGILLTNKFYVITYEGPWGRLGPEVEFRYERLPGGINNFWLFASLKYSFIK